MEKDNTRKRSGPPCTAMTVVLTLLLVICLAECASEQRINSRGSKASNLIQKINGWRSQRGGSCLSYGHSCWGAHGKRSNKAPASAPDWFLSKLVRRMDANSELNHAREEAANFEQADINAIYQQEPGDASLADRLGSLGSNSEDMSLEMAMNRIPAAKPMLDDDLLAKLNLWEIMREESGEK